VDTVVYPPAVIPEPFYKYFGPTVEYLVAGGSISATRLVILRGSRVRAAASFTITGEGSSNQPPPEHQVQTPAITLHLTQGRAPSVVLHRTPAVQASIHAAVQPGHGHLHIIQWVKCSGVPPSLDGGPNPAWQTLRRRTTSLRPTCSSGRPIEWHAAVGWLNQPVAYVDYVGT
jgi:hypothetical protein